jgi:hypothetical protein
MMAERRKRLEETVEVLASLIHCIQLHRALVAINSAPDLASWLVIYNALFDTAVIEWCKLFGSDDEDHQPTHWKHIVKDHDAFRAELSQKLCITWSEWVAYWDEMKKYRDNAVAHLSTTRRDIPIFPNYDLALRSAEIYYERVAAISLDEFGFQPFPVEIEKYSQAFSADASEFARTAVGATGSLNPTVLLRKSAALANPGA